MNDGDGGVSVMLVCPHCGQALEEFRAHGGGNRGPVPMGGDPIICVHCSSVLVFQADLTLRQATPAERDDFMKHPLFRRMLQQATLRRAKLQQ